MAEPNVPQQPPTSEAQQPGVVIAPGNQPAQPAAPSLAQPAAPPQLPVEPTSQPKTEWSQPVTAPLGNDVINWTASEFIGHHKTSSWYGALAGAAILGAGLVWLLTRDLISAAVVLFGALMFGIYAGRQPRQLEYQLDGQGLTIGQKHYPYEHFRSFAVVDEGAFASIMFLPLKRFAPGVSIYYAPDDEAAIIALLSDRLPSEDRGHDPIDRFMSRIRF